MPLRRLRLELRRPAEFPGGNSRPVVRPGKDISVTEHDGVARTFKVVTVGPVHHPVAASTPDGFSFSGAG